MAKDYYAILGVGKTASDEDIKKAFRKLAHQHHPDKKTGNVEKFKEINEAYQVLGNAEKRKQYDQFGSASFDGSGFGGGAGGFNWEDVMRQAGGQGGGGNYDFGDIDLGDLFGSAFGFGRRGGKASTGPQRGEDLQAELTLEFEESVQGAKRTIGLQRERTCEHCKGNGAEPGTKIVTCKDCNGAGSKTQAQRTPFGVFQTKTTCRTCSGRGQSFEKPCTTCRGTGLHTQRSELGLAVPAGIADGETIRVTGEGESGLRGGPAGDLYVHINVRPSKIFMRQGYDVLTHQMVDFPTMAMGGEMEVVTVDGSAKLSVPAGTQSGTKLKIKEKGMPRLNGRGRGDHIVEVTVQTPAKLSRQAKKLLEELKGELS